MKKSALVLGISGQDGSYLAELLLEKGYDVHGMIRRLSGYTQPNIEHIREKVTLHYGDLETDNQISVLVARLQPSEVYALASQSDVAVSFEIPEYTGNVTGLGVTRLLEAVRYFSPNSRVYNASSSEMFGGYEPPQNENTPMRGKSPYAIAKVYGHNMVRTYRESYNLFACSGICFNHESPRRGLNFVTRKISNAVARIHYGKQKTLELGNLDAKRDWGYAPDYVEAMWLMLQQDKPDDYVIGTGESHSVRDFAQVAFEQVGLDWQKYVVINPAFVRPSDVNYLQADTSKAQRVLGWKPKITFKELVKIMVKHDLELEKKL